MGSHKEQLEDGIFIGNQVDKGNIRNPIGRALVRGFDEALFAAVDSVSPTSIHEVGCGEGRLSRLLVERFGVPLLGTDFSEALIAENKRFESESLRYEQLSIYDLDTEKHRRDLVVCCEVLEHLEDPQAGLAGLARLGARAYVLSVPREPVWRVLNMARGKYWSDWGNTPGHLNHWSFRTFAEFLGKGGFRIKARLNPFPWTMVVAELVDA